MFGKIIKCTCCGYEESKQKWSLINVSSSDGYTFVTGNVYNLEKQERVRIGSVELLACPKCRTVTFD